MPAALSKTWDIPLWDARWNKPALLKRQSQIGTRAFDRGFRQKALSDAERTFSSFDLCLVRGLDINSVVANDWPRYMGVDPSGDERPGTCLFVLAKAPDGKRYPLSIKYGAWKPDRVADEVIRANNEYKPIAIYFENNALQDAFISLVKLRGGHDIPIRGFMTGKQKASYETGLPSLNIEFENKAWVIADPEHEVNCNCDVHRWFKEMRNHPLFESADGVMASWFAREASKLGGGAGVNAAMPSAPNRWGGIGQARAGDAATGAQQGRGDVTSTRKESRWRKK